MNWTECNDWKELPEGSWLVKVDKDKNPYHIATVTININDAKIIVVGGHFSWDMGKLIAYTSFERFEEL